MPQGVLILDDAGGVASGPFYNDVVLALRGSVNRDPAKQYSIYVEHLDFNRFRGPEYELGLKNFFATKYKDRPLGVIVAVGVGALQYVLRSRAELWPAVPVVFTFVNPQLLGALPTDVTGTTFRLKLSDMVAAARAVVPNLNQIAVVGDPLNTLVPYRNMHDEIPAVTATGLQILDLTGRPMRDVRTGVANLPVRTAILYPGMYTDGEGTYLTPVEGLRRFAEVANRPIIVTAETQLGPGTGGYIAVPSAIGQGAAVQVLRILQGERAAAIPVSEGSFVKAIFDWRQLQRWGVNESWLPPGSEVRFRELTIWQQYFWQMVAISAVVVLQALFIAALFYEGRRRRRSEANAHVLMAELTHMNRVVTAGQLTASIAHEIRQPLAAIAAFSNAGMNWLKHKTPDIDEVRSVLENIVKAVHRADEVIKSVTALFKKESTARKEVDLNKLVQQVLTSTARSIDTNKIALETNFVDSPPPIVMADSVQLQQVIMNLINNAIEAMSSSEHWARMLRIETNIDQADSVVITVADSGPGFDAKAGEQLFKPFFTTKSSGMGLGLPICKSIIEAHGGQLTAASREPRGAVFRLDLPRHRHE
jgi:signal transduction histidine kinase